MVEMFHDHMTFLEELEHPLRISVQKKISVLMHESNNFPKDSAEAVALRRRIRALRSYLTPKRAKFIQAIEIRAAKGDKAPVWRELEKTFDDVYLQDQVRILKRLLSKECIRLPEKSDFPAH
jgi:hypothetical protein